MVSRRRLERLEELVGLHDERPCDVCGRTDGWVMHMERYVDPDTKQEYAEPPRPEPCPMCGARPFVIVISCIQASWKHPGAPKETAVTMDDEQAGCWWRDHGGSPTLGQWFLARAGLAEPPHKVNCRLVHFHEFAEEPD